VGLRLRARRYGKPASVETHPHQAADQNHDEETNVMSSCRGYDGLFFRFVRNSCVALHDDGSSPMGGSISLRSLHRDIGIRR
jgi:hypothetical protein